MFAFTGVAQAGPKEVVDPCNITTCGPQEVSGPKEVKDPCKVTTCGPQKVSGPKEVKGLPKATTTDESETITIMVPWIPEDIVFLPQVSASWTILIRRQDLISRVMDPNLVVVTMSLRTSGGSIGGTTRNILTGEKAPGNTVLLVAIDASSPDGWNGWLSWLVFHTPASNIAEE